MINIYYGRESVDKSRFMFDVMGKKSILIVPDQYTLQAERDALRYLEKDAIMDIQVMGFTRFATGILKETGVRMDVISREGREMLLAGIVRKSRRNLKVFGGSSHNIEFVSILHDFIAEMKQSNAGPSELEEAIEKLKDGTLLKNKLKDVHYIYEKYCEAVSEKYMDNEDFMSVTAEKISQAESLDKTEIWLYGFDSFTGKHYSLIKALNDRGLSVNPVITWDEKGGSLFEITTRMIRKLKEISGEKEASLNRIPDEYKRKLAPEIAWMEEHYEEIAPEKIKSQGSIKMVRCSNPYSEACSAATWIWHLVREKGYRFRDIALICNNIDEQRQLYEMVFEDYGIKIFADCKRDAMYHPVMNLIVSVMKIISFDFQREDVIKYIKTGFTELSEDDIRKLEIYTFKYKITGHKWMKRFRTGLTEYDEEEIDAFEKMRQTVTGPLSEFKRKAREAKTVREKIILLYSFLDEKLMLREKLEEMVSAEEAEGRMELAGETAQLWRRIVEIFQQMIVLLGDEEVSETEFIELLKSGISSIEIGVIPPGTDGLVMGNIQRSRRENVKAAVIVCANEGVLPEGGRKGGIVSDDERNLLTDNKLEICKVSRLQDMEEKLALYRNFTRPSESVYISYPMADSGGNELEPSQVISKITDMIDGIEIHDDIFKTGSVEMITGGYNASKNSLIMAMADFIEKGHIKKEWIPVYNWYNHRENMDLILDRMYDNFKNAGGRRELVMDLYRKENDRPLRISPSRLELYGKCPFSHFVKYGLRPEEIRQYEIGSAEAGTVYHSCMMQLSKALSEGAFEKGGNGYMTGPDSGWMTVTREEVRKMIDGILKEISTEYKEGLLSSGRYEQYRAMRIQKVCEDSAWMAIDHVRRGTIKDMKFEIPFGKGPVPGYRVDTDSGQVSIEGQIDRWDILEGDFNKIIDYKSGNDKFDMKLAREGVKLQLFIYLMAVTSEKYRPGGAFYFHINEACENVPDKIGINEKELISQYKMDGFALGNDQLLSAIDKDLAKPSVYTKSDKRLFSEYEFEKNLDEIQNKIKEMSEGILNGKMDIKPKKINSMESCEYCPYKGICKFDLSLAGCGYNKK